MSAEALVELDRVTVAHAQSEEPLVSGVTWRLMPGEFWVITGDQGSGKTSLLLTMAGLQRPAAGTVRVRGRDVVSASEAEQIEWRRRMGFVFESPGRLLHHLTVAENIALPLKYHGEPAATERVEQLLTESGLMTYAHYLPSRLSPRLQHRVALVRALAYPTDVLFLDNPLGGLGPSGVQWWHEFIQQWRTKHPLAVVATATDSDEWGQLADHYAVLERGQFHIADGRN
ncbi:MAG: ATP-binding cassette domain-containing protein [Verrucomicrobiae bacterium]|nr:ATP-binding cassette domain-containing protein [Verrucomicrobiae bacterium]